MLKRTSAIVSICFCCARTASAMTIVERGVPNAVIVVESTALNPAKDDAAARKISVAAHDLQSYLQKISGATLPLVGVEGPRGGSQNAIYVGKSLATNGFEGNPHTPVTVGGNVVFYTNNQFPGGRKVTIPDGLTAERREEGFVIECHGNSLLLAGNDQGPYHGTEYAVYRFLQTLGVRWFMPGDYGEVAPHLPTIEVGELSEHETPSFIMRNWWAHMLPEMQPLEARWKIRNGMNPDAIFAVPGDSYVRNYTADPALAKTRPELFAKNLDGSPNPYLPNLGNPDAVKIAADKMKDLFRKNPGLTSAGFAPDDGMPRDFNADTLALNQNFTELGGREGEPGDKGISEEWFTFVNNVTKQVHDEFPDKIITTNGYANRDMPPQGVPLDPKIGVMYAAIWSDMLHAYDDPKSWMMVRQGENLQRWGKLCNKVWMYNYDYTMLVSGLTPVPTVRKIARDYPLLHKWGIIGFADETRNIWMEAGILTHYIRAQLEWNANADVKALQADFFEKWYGAAARPAGMFWDDMEAAIESSPVTGHEDRVLPPLYTPGLLSKLEGDISLAELDAHSDNEKAHVHVDRLILDHLKEYVAMNNAEYAGNFANAAQHADSMLQLRQQLFDIDHFWTLPKEWAYSAQDNYAGGVWYWSIQNRADYYRKLDGMISGKTGKLVAMLPERTSFNLDPQDEGRFAGWFKPDWDIAQWRDIQTTKPFYLQGYQAPNGYPYVGYLWYVYKVAVPEGFRGEPVHLFVPVVEAEGWVWANGKYAGHRRYRETYERPNDMDIDISTTIEPGKVNTIAIRVDTSLNPAALPGGLESRSFLYSPIPTVKGP